MSLFTDALKGVEATSKRMQDEVRIRRLEWTLVESGDEDEDTTQTEHVLDRLCRMVRNVDLANFFSDSIIIGALEKIRSDENIKIVLLENGAWSETEGEFLLLLIAVACLYQHLIDNYTGPVTPTDMVSILFADKVPNGIKCLSELERNGEKAYHLMRNPLAVVIASEILNRSNTHIETQTLWRMRCNFIHQRLLDGPVASLHDSIMVDIEAGQTLLNMRSNSDTMGAFLIETGCILGYYGKDAAAYKAIEYAGSFMGFHWCLTGVLGKRTKFQETDTSQLVVLAESRDRKYRATATSAAPPALLLNDDTLLDQIAFAPSAAVPKSDIPPTLAHIDPNSPQPLHPLDACILLALTKCIKNMNPADGLTGEEMRPFAERVLKHPSNWTVYTVALLTRSRLEAHRTRTAERSVLQLQALVDQLADDLNASLSTSVLRQTENLSAPASDRLEFAFQLDIPSLWQLEAELAARYLKIGAVRSALDIYTRLELWEYVVECHLALGASDAAKQVLKSQLELDPSSAKFWTLLGDVEQNTDNYLKAINVSDGRYAGAYIQLGRAYYAGSHNQARDVMKAMEYLSHALAINPIRHGSWFMKGCCAIELSDWESAAECFRRCVALDPSDGESWNNLATAYVRLDRKADAFRALSQALGSKYDSWRMWENFTIVAAALGEWPSVIRGIRRTVDLRGKRDGESCVDVELLEQLVGNVVQSGNDDEQAASLRRQLLDLLTNSIEPLITREPRLWDLMSRVWIWQSNWSQALAAAESAYRCHITLINSSEHLSDAVWTDAADSLEQLVNAYTNLGSRTLPTGDLVCPEYKHKSRSVIRQLQGRARDSPAVLDRIASLKHI